MTYLNIRQTVQRREPGVAQTQRLGLHLVAKLFLVHVQQGAKRERSTARTGHHLGEIAQLLREDTLRNLRRQTHFAVFVAANFNLSH